MRPNKIRKANGPDGHLRHAGRGLCDRCYKVNKANGTLNSFTPSRGTSSGTPTPDCQRCTMCERPIRPGHTTVDEYPGTLRSVKGHCYTCYPLSLRNVTPESIERTRRELDSYLAWRRPYRLKAEQS